MKLTKTDSKPQPVNQSLTRQCAANGCPRLGSITRSNTGDASLADWYCRFHFGEPPQQWDEITRKLRLEVANEV